MIFRKGVAVPSDVGKYGAMTEHVGSLAGMLLVAAPAVVDPTFERSVVLVLVNDAAGSLGVILNRASSMDVQDTFPDWTDLVAQPDCLFHGGPVMEDSAIGLAQLRVGAKVSAGASTLVAGHRMTSVDLSEPPDARMLEPLHVRIFAGHSSWETGQLEAEVESGSWILVQSTAADAFTGDPERLWADVLRRQSGRLRMVSTHPRDPSWN